MEHPKVPERKQTSMSSKRSERCNKTVNAKINDEKFLKDL